MTNRELEHILKKHDKWLNGEEGGECANMRFANLHGFNLHCANLHDADLHGSNLYRTDLRCADLRGADLRCANLHRADLRGANLDFSCWPLWCGSLGVHIDERIAKQLLYHLLYNVAFSKHISAEIKRTLLTPEIVALANDSHVVSEHCNQKIEPYKEEEICDT